MSKKQNIITLASAALTVALLAGCASDATDTLDPSADNAEIKVYADIWQVMDGTRSGSGTTTFNSAADLQREGFKCFLYNLNTTTIYDGVNGTPVTWSSSAWAFEGDTHKWPDNDGVLDFFAYSPQTVPTYITGPTYALNGTPAPAPYFTCAIPNDQTDLTDPTKPTDLKEFVWALTREQNRSNNASGVTMHFIHPFARICFALSPASGSGVEIKSVKITGSFYMTGTCTLSSDGATSTWSTSGEKPSAEIGGEIGKNYIAIPQDVGTHNVVVTANWTEISGDAEYTVPVTVSQWDASKSYTYTLTLSPTALKVDIDKYTEQW